MKARFILVMFSFLSASALAQNPGVVPGASPASAQSPAPQWGTASDIAYDLPAATFFPYGTGSGEGVAVWGTMGGGSRYRITETIGTASVTTNTFWDAPLVLPAGAKVTGLQVNYCDTDAVGNVQAVIQRVDEPSGANLTSFPPFAIGSSGTPGCGSTFADLTAYNLVINHVTNSYWVRAILTAVGTTVQLRGVTVFYRLQVSPAPATATFSDVPTSHPFFQYIEALAASGITAGCTAPPNPQYCPDAALTRGQMAVFLARALGLHFTP